MTLAPYNVVLVGAGEINFGSPEGPWNHTARLETILGARLQVLSVIDPDTLKGEERIADKRFKSSYPSSWASTKAHRNAQIAGKELHGTDVHLVVLGCPPHFRGTTEPMKDMDLQILENLPQAKGILIEKPVSAQDPLKTDCSAIASRLKDWTKTGKVVSIGYMLRYLSSVQKIKDILSVNKLVPTCINARYYMAYEHAVKPSWWNKAISCGPVVEQATHFVDLIRFIADEGNEVIEESVNAISVEHNEEAGHLQKLGFDENAIAPQERVPRVTFASWKHQKGTIGTLCHGITLHDHAYDTELEVLADGWVIKLKNAYSTKPVLSVIGPHSTQEEIYCEEDDPFLTQMETIVHATEKRKSSATINSSFEDALQTYNLTWQIRRQSERTNEKKR